MDIRSLGANVTKAQAASYLGPYLEEISVFEFEKSHQIQRGNCPVHLMMMKS
jgi:hypothetical protein